jgi:hypothetical protein
VQRIKSCRRRLHHSEKLTFVGCRQRGTPNKSTVLKNAAIGAAASDLNLSPPDFLDPNQANDAGRCVKAYIRA